MLFCADFLGHILLCSMALFPEMLDGPQLTWKIFIRHYLTPSVH